MSTYTLQDPFDGDTEVSEPEVVPVPTQEVIEPEVVPVPTQEVIEPEVVPVPPIPTQEVIEPEVVLVPTPEVAPESIPTSEGILEPEQIMPETTTLPKHQIYVNFKDNATSIKCTIAATNTIYNAIATNKELRLLQNRFYFIPISVNIDSDNFDNLKIFSDMADNIDIRYIKNNVACIMALKHNISIKHNQRLCIVW